MLQTSNFLVSIGRRFHDFFFFWLVGRKYPCLNNRKRLPVGKATDDGRSHKREWKRRWGNCRFNNRANKHEGSESSLLPTLFSLLLSLYLSFPLAFLLLFLDSILAFSLSLSRVRFSGPSLFSSSVIHSWFSAPSTLLFSSCPSFARPDLQGF